MAAIWNPHRDRCVQGAVPLSTPNISVVVVTYCRPLELERCLEALSQQSLTPREVVVVDNGAAMGGDARQVCETASTNSAVRYIISPTNSLPAARNLGVRYCAGDFVALIDDDVCLATDYLEAVWRVFELRPEAVGVQGYIYPGHRSQWRERIHRIFGLYYLEPDRCRVLPTISTTYPSTLTAVVPCEWMSGSNQVYRRKVLEEECWDERLLKYADGEDLDVSYRIHLRYPGRLFITPETRVGHDEAVAGRAVGRELIVMREVYGWYLLHKLFPASIPAKIRYLWSRLGRFAITIAVAVTGRRPGAKQEIRLVVAAYRFVWRHRKAFSAGDFGAFNAEFIYGDEQET